MRPAWDDEDDDAADGAVLGLADRTILCIDCRERFTYSVADQLHNRSKGFQAPKRCLGCRAAKRARQRAEPWPR